MTAALVALVATVLILVVSLVAVVVIVARQLAGEAVQRREMLRAVIAKNGVELDLLTRSSALERAAERPARETEPRRMPHGLDGNS